MVKHVISVTGSRGFTLLEMLIALTILVLLISAWPATFGHFFPRQRLAMTTRSVVQSLAASRAFARASGIPQHLRLLATGLVSEGAPDQGDWPAGTSVTLLDSAGHELSELWIYPDGSSTGGQLTFRYRQRQSTVLLGAVTGHAEVSE